MSLIVSILTGGVNSHQETSETANGVASDLISQGVVGAITNTSGVSPATGAFAVNAQGTPDMTVAVSLGYAYVTATPSSQNSQKLRVRNTASANVTISANASGSTKYDWLYISISAANAAAPNTAADNVATLVTSRSSSASTDDGTPPTYGYALAVVTVANAASSITNGNIADKRVQAGATPAALSVLYGNLLATIFSGQVLTQANAGTAGGTFSYVNLGGIKLLWINSATNLVTTTSATSYTFTLPTFFTTITGVLASAKSPATYAIQFTTVNGVSTSSIDVYLTSLGGVATCGIGLLVIGT